MGCGPSPYLAVRIYYLDDEFARGNPRLESNTMCYDSIRLNLPGSEGYQPDLHRVMKWDKLAKAIAGDVSTFVDDMRAAGFNFKNARQWDGDGWKIPDKLWEPYWVDKNGEDIDQPSSDDANKSVKASTGLFEAVWDLTVIFEPIEAPSISIHFKTVITIMIVFCNASGKEFGSDIQMESDNGLRSLVLW
jgi:hypothetical protein